MYGSQNAAVFMDPKGKSDFDAGLLFLSAAATLYPGLEWSDLSNPQFMAGWFTNLKKAVGTVKDATGGVLLDTAKAVGHFGGQVVRLAADPKVSDSIMRAGTAIATGGTSEAAGGIFDSMKNIFTPQGITAVEAAGKSYKSSMGGINFQNPLVLGGVIGGGLLLVLLIAKK